MEIQPCYQMWLNDLIPPLEMTSKVWLYGLSSVGKFFVLTQNKFPEHVTLFQGMWSFRISKFIPEHLDFIVDSIIVYVTVPLTAQM